MTIQWFPGHMTKAKREMQENLKLVDLVIELRDCRIPLSSKNPMLDEIIQTKPRLIVLSKKDKGEAEITQQWIEKLKDDTTLVLSLIHISEPTRQAEISYAVFCLKKKKTQKYNKTKQCTQSNKC